MPRLLMVLPLLLLCSPISTSAQVLPPTTEQVMGNPAPPTRTITLSDECTIGDIVWSDDSSRAYVSMSVNAVDVWPLLVFYWPEIAAGALSVTVLLVLAIMLRRRWKWRSGMAEGQPHCAKCAYQLTGRSDAKRCPECGRSLENGGIVIGRRLRRWPVVLTVALVVAFGAAYCFGRNYAPREGTFSYWRHWPSTRLYSWATTRQQWWLIRHGTGVVRLVEINPAESHPRRTIFTQPRYGRHGIQWNLRMLPGTQPDRLLLSASESVCEVDTERGNIIRIFNFPRYGGLHPSPSLGDIALHPSKPLLYAFVSGVDAEGVISWNLQSGELNEVVSYYEHRSRSYMRSLFVLPGSHTVLLRFSPHPTSDRTGFDLIDLNTLEPLLVHPEASGDLAHVIGLGEAEVIYTWTEFVGVRSQHIPEQTIMRWMPGMAAPEKLLTIPLRRIGRIEVGPQSGRLYFTGSPVASGPQLPVVAIYDRATGVYLQPLQSPKIGDCGLAISPDERWAITWYQDYLQPQSLNIFDLHAIHGPRAEP